MANADLDPVEDEDERHSDADRSSAIWPRREVFVLIDIALTLTRQAAVASFLPQSATETQCPSTARPWPSQRSSSRFSGRPPAGRLARSGHPEAWGTDPWSNWPPWSSERGHGAASLVLRRARSCGGPAAGCAAAPRGPERGARGSGRGLYRTTPGLADRREHYMSDSRAERQAPFRPRYASPRSGHEKRGRVAVTVTGVSGESRETPHFPCKSWYSLCA
jgi:hypothetical protein